MLSKKALFTALLCGAVALTAIGQNFLPPVTGFSKKKTAYFNMENGDRIEATIKSFDWKKGLIEEVKIVDMNGKKVKIQAEDIKSMYLPPSGFSKFASAWDHIHDVSKWERNDLEADIITKGYSYMEKSEVRIKKKTRTLMVQLLNPSFSSNVKVYHDPITGETASLKVPGTGITVAGGLAKTFFVKKAGDKVAYELKKKNYDEEFKLIFGDCPAVKKKYGKNPKWADLEKHVYEYSQECGKN